MSIADSASILVTRFTPMESRDYGSQTEACRPLTGSIHTVPPPGKPQLLVPLASHLPSQHTPTHKQIADSPGE